MRFSQDLRSQDRIDARDHCIDNKIENARQFWTVLVCETKSIVHVHDHDQTPAKPFFCSAACSFAIILF